MDKSVVCDVIGLKADRYHIVEEIHGISCQELAAVAADQSGVGDDIRRSIGGVSPHSIQEIVSNPNLAGTAKAIEKGIVGDDVRGAAMA